MFGASLPQSLYPLVPGYSSWSLRRKTAAGDPDTLAAAITVHARKRSADIQEILQSGIVQGEDPLFMVSVYDIGEASFVAPAAEDELIGPDGIKYRVRHVNIKVLDTLHKCICSRKRDQS